MRTNRPNVQQDLAIEVHGLRAKLKEATASVHRELEDLLSIMDPLLSSVRYFNILSELHCFHDALENHLEKRIELGCEASIFYLNDRRKSHLLRKDLRNFQLSQDDGKEAFDLSWMNSTSKIYGALYVVEGSTLGSQVICRHLKSFGKRLDSEVSTNFFEGYGNATGVMWQRFLRELQGVPHDEERAAVESGVYTFQMLISRFERCFASAREKAL